MSGGAENQSSTGQSTTTQALDPQVKAALLGNFGHAQGIAATPFQPFTGQFTAGLTPQQIAAGGMVNGIAANNPGAAATSAGVNAATGVAGFTPSSVTAPTYSASTYDPSFYSGSTYDPATIGSTPQASASGYNPFTLGSTAMAGAAQANPNSIPQLSGGTLSTDQINHYMNPYIGDVVDTNASDIDRTRQIQNLDNNAKATAAHAFGGTGWGTLVGQTNDSATRASAASSAALRKAGWDSATALGQQDLDRQLSAGQTNQGSYLQTLLANLGNRQQSGLANAAASNQTGALNLDALNRASEYGATAGNDVSKFNTGNDIQSILANIASMNTAGQFNAGQTQAAHAANAGAANTASAANAGATNIASSQNMQAILSALQGNQTAGIQGANLNLQGASALGTLGAGQHDQALASANAVNASGVQDQQTQQAQLSALLDEFLRGQNDPMVKQQLLNQALGLAGNPVLGQSQSTQSSSGNKANFSLFG